MITYNQRCGEFNRVTRIKKVKVPVLLGNPHRKAQVKCTVIRSPKKPHSAKRKTAKIEFISNKKPHSAYSAGEGLVPNEYSLVLIRGGRRRDIPGMRCQIIRGKYDGGVLSKKINGRSKYGIKKIRSF